MISLEEDLVRFSNLLTAIGQLEWLCQYGSKGPLRFASGKYAHGRGMRWGSQTYPYQLLHARKHFARLIKVIRKKRENERDNTERGRESLGES